MLKYIRERAAIRRQLVKTEMRYMDELISSYRSEDFERADSQLSAARQHFIMELEALEAEHLRNKAAKYGVVNLPPQEIYKPKIEGAEPHFYFKSQNKAELVRLISEARFNYWKKWSDLLIPILSLIIAVLVLLKDFLTDWLKRP